MAISSLCSNNPKGINESFLALSELMDLDLEMARTLVMISLQAVDQLASGVAPLAKRLDLNIGITMGFVAAGFRNVTQTEQAL